MEEQVQQAPPQEGQAQSGGDVIKQLMGAAMKQSETIKAMGQAVTELGAKEPAAKIMQAAQLIEVAMQELAGGPQKQPVGGGSPDTAGVEGAVPADGMI